MNTIAELSKVLNIKYNTILVVIKSLVTYQLTELILNKSVQTPYGKMEIIDGKLTITEQSELVSRIISGEITVDEFINTQITTENED